MQQEDDRYLLPLAKYLWNAPFWVPAVHLPFAPSERRQGLEAIRTRLDASAPIPGIRRWRVENLSDTGEPWRQQLRMRHRLVAELEDDEAITRHVAGCLDRHGLADAIEVRPIGARLYYEDFGLGCLEYQLELALSEGRSNAEFTSFLLNRDFWGSMDFYGLREANSLRLQAAWPKLRETLHHAIAASGLARPFHEFEAFLHLKRGEASGRHAGGPAHEPARPQDQNDLCWAYCMDLILFRDPDLPLESGRLETFSGLVHRIGNTLDARTDPRQVTSENGDRETAYARTKTILLDLPVPDERIEFCYAGFSMVAVVTEAGATGLHPGEEGEAYWAPTSASSRVAALRRRALLNYAALTEAADGLRAYLSSMLFAKEAEAPERHEQLRRVTATLAIVRYDAREEVIQADDVETLIYEPLAASWDLGKQQATLRELIEDADRATSRISETNTQAEERNLNFIVVCLAVITLASGVHDLVTFLLEPRDPGQWSAKLILTHIAIIGSVWGFVIWYVWRSRVLTPRSRKDQ